MTDITTWLTTTELERDHGVKPSKARYHVKKLEAQGLAKKETKTGMGFWLFSPDAVDFLKTDHRADKAYMAIEADQVDHVTQVWQKTHSVSAVRQSLKISWYTAARWLDSLGLRPMPDGVGLNYAKRGKKT